MTRLRRTIEGRWPSAPVDLKPPKKFQIRLVGGKIRWVWRLEPQFLPRRGASSRLKASSCSRDTGAIGLDSPCALRKLVVLYEVSLWLGGSISLVASQKAKLLAQRLTGVIVVSYVTMTVYVDPD